MHMYVPEARNPIAISAGAADTTTDTATGSDEHLSELLITPGRRGRTPDGLSGRRTPDNKAAPRDQLAVLAHIQIPAGSGGEVGKLYRNQFPKVKLVAVIVGAELGCYFVGSRRGFRILRERPPVNGRTATVIRKSFCNCLPDADLLTKSLTAACNPTINSSKRIRLRHLKPSSSGG
jgi:hypothetical protein